MDPESAHDPTEAPTPAPEPMTMERSLSSESGSNSSLSTVYFTKKSGSASSSRSGSAASTSRSPPDQEVAARLLSWPSPSFAQGQGQGHAKDEQDSSKISMHSPEKEKNDSTLITKADSTGAFQQAQPETTVTQELQKSSDTIVKEFRHTESIMIKEAEQAADSCCSCCRPCSECCRSCGTWGFCGDLAAVLCCPLTFISLLSCMCFRCPKMFVKSIKSRGKGEERQMNREESESTESKEMATSEVSPRGIAKDKDSHSEGHHDDKPEATATTTLGKGAGSFSEKKDTPIDSHRNYFFPSPEGGDKAGGR